MKHTGHSKGCPHSHNTQCSPLWQQRRRVFSYANGQKGAECHPAIDCPKNLVPIVAIRQWLWHALLILQAFLRFTYVAAHFPTLPSFYLRHSSFSNPYVASPTSQLILQPFFRFSYVTGFSLTSPGEPHFSGSVHTHTDTHTHTHIIYHLVFCPSAGPLLQAEEPRLQFCRRQVFHRKLRNQGCSFTWD